MWTCCSSLGCAFLSQLASASSPPMSGLRVRCHTSPSCLATPAESPKTSSLVFPHPFRSSHVGLLKWKPVALIHGSTHEQNPSRQRHACAWGQCPPDIVPSLSSYSAGGWRVEQIGGRAALDRSWGQQLVSTNGLMCPLLLLTGGTTQSSLVLLTLWTR